MAILKILDDGKYVLRTSKRLGVNFLRPARFEFHTHRADDAKMREETIKARKQMA